MTARFALYLAPEADEPLWRFGSAWLGYDARTGADLKHVALPGVSTETIREVTAHPRLYGLHITLKAPFRLTEGVSVQDLERAVEDLARRHDPFGPFVLELEARKAGEDRFFLCLAPADRQQALHHLEADAVVALDSLRAPLTSAEIARRKPDCLSPKERGYLKNYGYPHVLDSFRPHISLTGPIPEDTALQTALAERLNNDPALMVLACRSLLLFEQPEPGARFQVRQRHSLG